jgi:DNA-binding SARP family transcriptional activator
MLSLRLFGGISLSDSGSAIPVRANQRRRLALLAILSVSVGKTVARDRLAVLLWPEADAEHARHLLSDSIYVLRSTLGDDLIITSGESVSINIDRIRVDIVEFAHAIEKGDYAKAVQIRNGGGEFLDGVHLVGSQEFDHWADAARRELSAAYHDALKRLARASTGSGDLQGAVTWWRRLAAEDPLSATVALELMRAHDSAADRGAALAYARVYENLVGAELDSPPDPSITDYAQRLRRGEGDRTSAKLSEISDAVEKSDVGGRASVPPTAVEIRRPSRPRPRRTLAYGTLTLLLVAAGSYAALRARSPKPSVKRTAALPPTVTDYRSGLRTRNPAAYDLYLRGRHDREMRSDTGFRAAVADYRAAIQLDSSFADAYAGLSEVYTLLWVVTEFDANPSRETALKAESAAVKAVTLAEDHAEGHLALGVVRLGGRINLAEAEKELLRARALDPADPRTREYLIALHTWTGRSHDALREARAGVSADPLSMGALRELGRALYASHRYEEELVELDRMRAIGPVRAANQMAGETYALEGRYSAALRELGQRPGQQYLEALRGYVLARRGNRGAADSVLADLTDRWRRGRGGAFEIAVVYTGMQDFDLAFEWIDKSFEDLSTRADIMDPLFDDLRADRRFASVARRMGLNSPAAKLPSTVAGILN